MGEEKKKELNRKEKARKNNVMEEADMMVK